MEASARLFDARIVLDDRVVLRNIQLEVGPGVTVVRGPNGAGKTSLLRAIAGLLPLASGRREISGTLISLGHRPGLLRGLTARENLRFLAKFRGVRTSEAALDDALGRWGVRDDADRPVERLSAGQRRRTALARLETEQPTLILLDEPFGELDEEAAAHLRAGIRRFHEEGRTIVIASHAHPELDGAARVVRLAAGRLA